MYKEAYELIREILEDDKLNEFVQKTTGKRLAIIDSGPKVTFPAAGIMFRGGEISRPDNNMQEVQYDVPFGLPYFDANAMARSLKPSLEGWKPQFSHALAGEL